MREIKFKAWFKGSSDHAPAFIQGFNMVNFHSYFNKGLEPHVYRYGTQWKLSEIILLQFTGLKDKNGKEIYEGDVLYDPDYSMISGSDQMPDKRIVVWHHDHATFKLGYADPDVRNGGDFPSGKYLCEINCRDSFEVIGNIYENPELLKV